MPRLIEHVLKRKDNKDIKIKSVLGDGSYDSNENFKNLLKKRIMPCIKVRKNSIISSKNNKLKNREVECQTKVISSNGKRKKDMDRGGLLKLFSLL
jgi:Transposase DDE domain